jgi:hypothetical protein
VRDEQRSDFWNQFGLVLSSSGMAYKALVATCPKTGKDLEVADPLALDDPRFPIKVRVKSLLLPMEIARCPECGETHTFTKEKELREVIVEEAQ